MRTIGTEERFVTEAVLTAWSGLDADAGQDSRASVPPGEMGERLRELGERRIAAMDEAGLDVQVISLTSPGLRVSLGGRDYLAHARHPSVTAGSIRNV